MEQFKTYKIALMGDGGVGKSVYVKKLLTGNFEKRYIATLGVEVHPFQFFNDKDEFKCTFNIWDTAGQKKFGGLGEGYYIESDAAIIMFDITSEISFESILRWKESFENTCPNAPILLVGNKTDIPKQRIKPEAIRAFCMKHNLPYIQISSKTNYNLLKPFDYLKQMIEDNKIGTNMDQDIEVVSTMEEYDERDRFVANL